MATESSLDSLVRLKNVDGDTVSPEEYADDPKAVAHQYLRDAIDAVLASTAPTTSETAPKGCTIKWR